MCWGWDLLPHPVGVLFARVIDDMPSVFVVLKKSKHQNLMKPGGSFGDTTLGINPANLNMFHNCLLVHNCYRFNFWILL